MEYTPDQIRGMTVHERHRVWKRARSRTDEEAREIVRLIEQSGLPYRDRTAITTDDPITMKMHQIINSPEAKAAMISTTERGLPAIDGVDRRLSEELGLDYGGHNMATNTAGVLVAECMQQLGYRKTGRKGKLTEGSVAKTGEIFLKR
jgi:hypothetical protein